MKLLACVPFAIGLAIPCAANAALPPDVQAIVDAALATGDPKKVETVLDLVEQTNPDDAEEVQAIRKTFLDDRKKLAEAEAARKEEEIRSAGIFENWKGEGEIGAFRATGNSENTGLSVALNLKRQGIDWTHQIRARADYQESNDVTTREQYFAAYEPRYQINERLFGFGLAQFDRNTFQGFDARYALSGGLGYKVIDGDNLTLSVKAGPAYRRTELVTGVVEDELAALVGTDFDWQIADWLTLTQDSNVVADSRGSATVIIDGSSTTLNLITALRAKVTDRLSTRLAYQIDYDSSPAAGAETTDTLSRFTLVYGF